MLNKIKRKIKNILIKENIKFYGFWTPNIEKTLFYKILVRNKIFKSNKKYIFFSTFSKRKENLSKFSEIKVFFTGENVHDGQLNKIFLEYEDNLIKDVDLSLGFDYLEHENYLRFPLWILYLIDTNWSYEDIKKRIDEINNPEYRLNNNRTKFASQISRHDTKGIRKKMIEKINQIEKVDCAGIFMNNTNELKEKYSDNKIEYLKTFKFNICPENSSTKGYVTEKIFEAIFSGCIPIYWGSEGYVEPEILNKEAFIYFEESKEEQIIEKIKRLWESEEEYKKFISIPPFKKDAAKIIWEKLKTLDRKFKELENNK